MAMRRFNDISAKFTLGFVCYNNSSSSNHIKIIIKIEIKVNQFMASDERIELPLRDLEAPVLPLHQSEI